MNAHLRLSLVAATLALGACSKAPEPVQAAPAAPPASAPAVDPAALPQAAQEGMQVATEMAATPPPAGVNGQPVDICAMLDRAGAEKYAGALYRDPKPGEPQGSLLGQCDYIGPKAMVMISARPASEFKATVDYASKKGDARPVDGLAGPATATSSGVMWQPDGKPYFVVVFAMSGGKVNEATSIELTRSLKI
ncbi:MAG TPA: hypothetical protein VM074_01445 [Solimonas sp.]|nr:hypothetical protein [Solimonas sp.]